MEKIILYGSLLIALLAFAFAAWLYLWVKRQPCENQKIIKACGLIRAGARTFLRKEYAVLAKFAGVAAVLILVFLPTPIWKGTWQNNVLMMVAYIFGTAFSAIAGKIGLEVATIANGRSAEAAKQGIKPSFCWLSGGCRRPGAACSHFCISSAWPSAGASTYGAKPKRW